MSAAHSKAINEQSATHAHVSDLRYGALRTTCVISGLFNTCCFIAETDKFVAITFRGTCTMANIMHDLTADWVHMPGTLATSSVRVHHGFTLAYNSIRFCVLQKLRAMHKANPDRALLVTVRGTRLWHAPHTSHSTLELLCQRAGPQHGRRARIPRCL